MSSLPKYLTPWRWFSSDKPIVTVVSLQGAIGADARPGRGLSTSSIEPSLKKAFKKTDRVRAVVLAINSPGGAPAQARMIMERARGLAREKQVPLISYIEDIGASGGYLIAIAGEEILADPFAIVGSIGVVSAGFGFQDAISRIGVERRVTTAGTNKWRLDPFQEQRPEDRAKLEGVLEETHRLFIDLVRQRRGDRITGPDDKVFSGDFFLAGEGEALGLIDGVGDLRELMKERFGQDVEFRMVNSGRSGLLALLSSSIAGALIDTASIKLKGEALRARMGLGS